MEEMKNYASKGLAGAGLGIGNSLNFGGFGGCGGGGFAAAVDAGIKASGGLEIALPMAARIRLSQADADDFFERLG